MQRNGQNDLKSNKIEKNEQHKWSNQNTLALSDTTRNQYGHFERKSDAIFFIRIRYKNHKEKNHKSIFID